MPDSKDVSPDHLPPSTQPVKTPPPSFEDLKKKRPPKFQLEDEKGKKGGTFIPSPFDTYKQQLSRNKPLSPVTNSADDEDAHTQSRDSSSKDTKQQGKGTQKQFSQQNKESHQVHSKEGKYSSACSIEKGKRIKGQGITKSLLSLPQKEKMNLAKPTSQSNDYKKEEAKVQSSDQQDVQNQLDKTTETTESQSTQGANVDALIAEIEAVVESWFLEHKGNTTTLELQTEEMTLLLHLKKEELSDGKTTMEIQMDFYDVADPEELIEQYMKLQEQLDGKEVKGICFKFDEDHQPIFSDKPLHQLDRDPEKEQQQHEDQSQEQESHDEE